MLADTSHSIEFKIREELESILSDFYKSSDKSLFLSRLLDAHRSLSTADQKAACSDSSQEEDYQTSPND